MTVRQGECQRALEQKPKNPYASLKPAKREQTCKAAVGAGTLYPLQAMVADPCPKPPKKAAAARRVGKGIEGQQGGSKYKTVAKKTIVMKEAATPSKKRKAGEDLQDVSAAVRDIAKEATSTIYKKRRVEVETKAEAVVDTKLVEREARVSLGKKRKAADALEGDTAQAVVQGVDAPPAKKRRTEDEPVVETGSLGEKKAKNVKVDEVFDPSRRPSWSGSHVTIGSISFKARRQSSKVVYSKGSNEMDPWGE